MRCTVYDLWFNSLCCFCVDWTLCHVVSASNQKMKEQSVSSHFVWRYSFSQLSIRTLEYLVKTIYILLNSTDSRLLFHGLHAVMLCATWYCCDCLALASFFIRGNSICLVAPLLENNVRINPHTSQQDISNSI